MLAALLLFVAVYFHTFMYILYLFSSLHEILQVSCRKEVLRGIFQTKFCLVSLLALRPNFILKVDNFCILINKSIEGIFKTDFPFQNFALY